MGDSNIGNAACRTGSRVLVETTRGIFQPATVVAVLPDGWLTLAIDGERVKHDWPADRYISADVIDVTSLPCDDCGKPEHDGECGGWADSNEALGVSLGAGSY